MDRIKLIFGDITQVPADAVVNAANSDLREGAGVSGAIHSNGGPSIKRECKEIIEEWGPVPPGDAVMTGAGRLPAKRVIHAVAPEWRGGNRQEFELLERAYRSALELAAENGFKSIAFPAIGTGVFAFPKDEAAEIAYETISDFLENNEWPREVILVCFDQENFEIYTEIMEGK
jgi:O-acetyl-ADP-ribose deacetylase